MVIKTESGAIYTIKDGLAKKTRDGVTEDVFKCSVIKPFPEDWQEGTPVTYEWIDGLPEGQPVIGRRLYLGGYGNWWITTEIASVEDA